MTEETRILLSDIVKIMGGASIAGLFAIIQSWIKNKKESQVFIREYNIKRIEKCLDIIDMYDRVTGQMLLLTKELKKENISTAEWRGAITKIGEEHIDDIRYLRISLELSKDNKAYKEFQSCLSITEKVVAKESTISDIGEDVTDKINKKIRAVKKHLVNELKVYTQ